MQYRWKLIEDLDGFADLLDTGETAAYERVHTEVCRRLQTLVTNGQLLLNSDRFLLVLPAEHPPEITLFLTVATLDQLQRTRLFPSQILEEAGQTQQQKGSEFTQAVLIYQDRVTLASLMLPWLSSW